ncbi:MAG: transketolase [Anaerolineae bacterium]|nr:MAG: transketolase [Anaerolineae bacterium]
MISLELKERAINTLRFLSADAVQKANSGHPGLPMGAAAIAYTIWTRHLRHNPANPQWINRDRFVLSGGHGSMLLYSLLHLSGYDLGLDELKSFRQWESRTPGHPEYRLTPGVETTTGPLGQGFANGVGMGIAAYWLAERFNRPGFDILAQFIYAIVTDGDLMEGVASEAASLAGHQKLGNLIYVYDDNHISIDGDTSLTFTEDRGKRFEAYGWHVQYVADGNDVDALDLAISAAKTDPRPSLIVARTVIGYGLPTRAGTAKAHGEPPGTEELKGAKEALGWPTEPSFLVPEDVRKHFLDAGRRGAELEKDWRNALRAYATEFPSLASELERITEGHLPASWDKDIPVFAPDAKGMATRVSSGKVINAIGAKVPDLLGGSADLHPSTKTWIEGSKSFQPENRAGRNIHYGVREHGMGGIVNGLATFPGIIPFGATFLVFADYMRGAIRLSAISRVQSIWVFTHDSVGVGEDGPTHQPVEHIASLRAIPGMVVLRPMDANEVSEAWRTAIERRDGPTCLLLTRQDVPTYDRARYASANGLARGAYVLADLGDGAPNLILMASGSEVRLILEVGERLANEGQSVRVVSFPSWELFENQAAEYRHSVLPPELTRRLAVEAGVSQGWHRWVGPEGELVTLDRFGASAPGDVVFEKLGFSAAAVYQKALAVLNR